MSLADEIFISNCKDILESMQGAIQKGGCQYERTTNI